jgi:hypothetical protein
MSHIEPSKLPRIKTAAADSLSDYSGAVHQSPGAGAPEKSPCRISLRWGFLPSASTGQSELITTGLPQLSAYPRRLCTDVVSDRNASMPGIACGRLVLTTRTAISHFPQQVSRTHSKPEANLVPCWSLRGCAYPTPFNLLKLSLYGGTLKTGRKRGDIKGPGQAHASSRNASKGKISDLPLALNMSRTVLYI